MHANGMKQHAVKIFLSPLSIAYPVPFPKISDFFNTLPGVFYAYTVNYILYLLTPSVDLKHCAVPCFV